MFDISTSYFGLFPIIFALIENNLNIYSINFEKLFHFFLQKRIQKSYNNGRDWKTGGGSMNSWLDQIRLDHALRKLQQEDKKAWEEIYQLLYPTIFRYTFSLVKDYYQAEDITQEVFIRIEKYKHRYVPGTNVKAWVYQMTKNLIYTKLRQKKEVAIEDEKLDFLIHQEYLKPTTDLSFVNDALGCLTEKEKQVVTLHLYGGLKHYETAKVLHLPYSKVRSTYTYALAKIRKKLGGRL